MTLKLKTYWPPAEIKAKLDGRGGVGFVFHATDHDTISLGTRTGEYSEDALWTHGPVIGSPIFFGNEVVGAHIIAPPPAFLWVGSHSGIKRFRQQCYEPGLRMAEEAGLTHLGLAALVPFATNHGQYKREMFGGVMTTGHAATVATIWHTVQALSDTLDFDPARLRYAIFGAAGSIGSNTVRWLISNGVSDLILVDKPERYQHLLALANELVSPTVNIALASGDLGSLPPFDIGIIATSSTTPWIGQELLAKAPVWIDDSHPRAATLEAEQTLQSSVMYLECFLRGPHGLCQVFPFRLPTSRDCYSCFAEAFISWQMKMDYDFAVGPVKLHQIAVMSRLLPEHEFRPGPFTSKGGQPISAQTLQNVESRLGGR